MRSLTRTDIATAIADTRTFCRHLLWLQPLLSVSARSYYYRMFSGI